MRTRRAWLGPALTVLLAVCSCNRVSERSDNHASGTPSVNESPAVVLVPANGAAPSRVRVEVARTPEERARGLMYRRELAEGAGMLFLFDNEEPQRFWMRNTFISLDMIFFDAQRRVVGVEEQTIPHDESPRGPDQPAQYVLEVPAGYSRRHGISLGARAEFVGLP